MRKVLLILAAALLAGGALYLLMASQHGYLLLSVGNYVLETSLWGALLLVLAVLLVVYLLGKFWRLVILPRHWWRQRAGRKQLRVRNQTVQGMLDYLQGNWPSAVNNLRRGVTRSDMPALNYLGAAAASFNVGDNSAAEALLRQAEEGSASDALTVGLLRTRMLLQDNRFDAALPLVEGLHRKAPNHPTLLRLLASTKKGLRDWHGVELLLPDLKKYQAVSSAELESLEVEVYREVINGFALSKSARRSAAEQQSELDHLWERLPSRLQKHSELVAAYVGQLHRLGADSKAETRLRKFINQHWQSDLVPLYASLQGDTASQLIVAEAWLRDHPDDPVLLQALARLCLRSQLWGKAKDYFEAALRLKPSPELWLELGELLQILQDAKGSQDCFRKGLVQAVGR